MEPVVPMGARAGTERPEKLCLLVVAPSWSSGCVAGGLGACVCASWRGDPRPPKQEQSMSLEVVSAAQMRWWIDGGSQHHYSFFLAKEGFAMD